MRVRTDDEGAVREAWSAYEGWLEAQLAGLGTEGVLSIELAPAMRAEGLVPSVDVYAEGDDLLSASATGNGMLAGRFRMTLEFKSELALTWTPDMSNHRGVVLWRLDGSRSECGRIAAAVCRVLGAGFKVPHPVWLVTQVDGRPVDGPDWRAVHRDDASAGGHGGA